MKTDAIMITDKDNVATALRDLRSEETATVSVGGLRKQVELRDAIPYGHKFAVVDIEKGTHIVKYGEIIGRATQSIARGGHAHVHNIESLRGRGDRE